MNKKDKAFILHNVCSLWQDLSVCTKSFNPVSVTLTLSFDLLLNKTNLGHNFWTKTDRAFILHVYSSWQDLSGSTKIVHIMTLTVTFNLILRNWKCLITIISSQVYRSVGGLVLLEQPCSSCVFLVDQPFHLV